MNDRLRSDAYDPAYVPEDDGRESWLTLPVAAGSVARLVIPSRSVDYQDIDFKQLWKKTYK